VKFSWVGSSEKTRNKLLYLSIFYYDLLRFLASFYYGFKWNIKDIKIFQPTDVKKNIAFCNTAKREE